MKDRSRKSWLPWVLVMYGLHGIWLAIHARTMKEMIGEAFPVEGVSGVRFSLVSLLQMLVEEAPACVLAIAGVAVTIWCGKGGLRVGLVILGLALWAAYAWMWVFLIR